MILTPSNIISLLRGPLAFLFIIDNSLCRGIAIILAMLTDSLDGYLARRYQTTTRLGAILDPAMDKFFVCFITTIFYMKAAFSLGRLSPSFHVILPFSFSAFV